MSWKLARLKYAPSAGRWPPGPVLDVFVDVGEDGGGEEAEDVGRVIHVDPVLDSGLQAADLVRGTPRSLTLNSFISSN